MSKQRAANAAGYALSPATTDAPRRGRARGHRYKFCFIIPAYAGKRNANGEQAPHGVLNLMRCLDSINAQTDRDCKVIVVNDGHSAEMRDLIEDCKQNMRDIPMLYLEAPYRGKRGGHESVNLALSILPPDVQYVTIVNGDNTIRPQYVERMWHPEYDIITCMVRMNDLPGVTLNGHSFTRGRTDRLCYTIRADIAQATEHGQHMDADCDYVIDCLAMAENGIYHVDEELAEHN